MTKAHEALLARSTALQAETQIYIDSTNSKVEAWLYAIADIQKGIEQTIGRAKYIISQTQVDPSTFRSIELQKKSLEKELEKVAKSSIVLHKKLNSFLTKADKIEERLNKIPPNKTSIFIAKSKKLVNLTKSKVSEAILKLGSVNESISNTSPAITDLDAICMQITLPEQLRKFQVSLERIHKSMFKALTSASTMPGIMEANKRSLTLVHECTLGLESLIRGAIPSGVTATVGVGAGAGAGVTVKATKAKLKA